MTTSALSAGEPINTVSYSALPSSRDPESANQRQYEWIVEVAGTPHAITLFHSKKTGMVNATIDGKQFYDRYIPPNDIYFCYFYAVPVKGCRMDIIHTPEGVELSINERNFSDIFREQHPDVEISKVRLLPERSAVRQSQQNNSVTNDPRFQPQIPQSNIGGQPSTLRYSVAMPERQEAVRQMESVITGSPVPFQPSPPQAHGGYAGYPPPPATMQYGPPQPTVQQPPQLPPAQMRPPIQPVQPLAPLTQPNPQIHSYNPNASSPSLSVLEGSQEIGPSMLYQGQMMNQMVQRPITPPGTSLVFPDDPKQLEEMMKTVAFNPYMNVEQPQLAQQQINGYGRGSQEASLKPGSESQKRMQQVPQMMPPQQALLPASNVPYPPQYQAPPQQYQSPPQQPLGFDPVLSNPLSSFFAQKLATIVNQNNMMMQQQFYGSAPPNYGSVPPVNYGPPPVYGSQPPFNYGSQPQPQPQPQPPQPPQPLYYGQPTMSPFQQQPVAQPTRPGSSGGYGRTSLASDPPKFPPFQYPSPIQQQPMNPQQPPPNYPQQPFSGQLVATMNPSSQKDLPRLNPQAPPPALQNPPTLTPQGPRPPIPKSPTSNPAIPPPTNDKIQQKPNSDSQLRTLQENTETVPPKLTATGIDNLMASTPDLNVMAASKEPVKPTPVPQMRHVESQLYVE